MTNEEEKIKRPCYDFCPDDPDAERGEAVARFCPKCTKIRKRDAEEEDRKSDLRHGIKS